MFAFIILLSSAEINQDNLRINILLKCIYIRNVDINIIDFPFKKINIGEAD